MGFAGFWLADGVEISVRSVAFLRAAILAVVLLRSSTPFSQMMDRVAVDLNPSDSARWQIFFQWIDSWLDASFFWGQGWGVIPSGPWPLGVWRKTRTTFIC